MSHRLLDSNSALILGHPGHELRVLGWVKEAKPLVIVLTDGSGHTTQPRIGLTQTLLEEAGAVPAVLFGTYTDEQIYQQILAKNFDFFRDLQKQITSILIEHEINVIVGDAIEGYNPSHDLCRCLVEGAVDQVRMANGNTPLNYEFPLVAHPAVWSDQPGSECFRLNDEATAWKLDQIRSYAQTVGGTLLTEVDEFLKEFGEKALAEEWLTASYTAATLKQYTNNRPFYETHGRKQVAAGYYKQAILFNEHILPLIAALGMDLGE